MNIVQSAVELHSVAFCRLMFVYTDFFLRLNWARLPFASLSLKLEFREVIKDLK